MNKSLIPATLVIAMASVLAAGTFVSKVAADDDDHGDHFEFKGDALVVSRSVYVDTKSITAGTTVLPPDCSTANCPTPVTAVTDGTYPYVFNNDLIDASFGITSKIFLDQMTPNGKLLDSLEVPNSLQRGVGPNKNQMVTKLLLEIRIGFEPIDRRQLSDFHGLSGTGRRN